MKEILKGRWVQALWKKDAITKEFIRQIYPRDRVEVRGEQIWRRRIAVMGGIVFGGIVLLLLGNFVYEKNTFGLDKNVLQRTSPDIPLVVRGNGENGEWQKEMNLHLEERKFTEQECEKMEMKVQEYLEQTLLGENRSAESITSKLLFSKEIPDTEILLNWIVDDRYINEQGEIRFSAVPQDGVDTEVTVEAEYRNFKKTYHYPIHIVAKQLFGAEREIAEVKEEIKKAIKQQKTEDKIILPDTLGNTKLNYEVKQDKDPPYLLVLMMMGIVLYPLCERERQKKQLEARKEQLALDHPGIVNKVMLLLGAGLTLRQCFLRLAQEYEEQRKKTGERRYAYEEICIMINEIQDGMPDIPAVEQFGKRCGIQPYLRFASIISQNLRKGSQGLIEILEQEALEAFDQRKQQALRMGETASTKLLFPMMIMLGLVMGIIMVPAFMSM